LRPSAVQADVKRPRGTSVGAAADGQCGGVQSIAAGDQDAELIAADRIWPGKVAHACVIGGGQLENGSGEVGDMNGTPDFIGEQHAISSPGGQIVDECLVRRADTSEDQ
jgi:hypothetical protein